MNFTTFQKDPGEVLDFKFDYANTSNGGTLEDYLELSETISTIVVAVDTGIVVDSSSITDNNTTVTIWLSGGIALTNYVVTIKATTTNNRTVERSIIIECVDR